MLFNSPEFIFIFLPIVYFVYLALNNKYSRQSKYFLVLASLFFYGWWKIIYLPIIIISVLFNYYIGKNIINIKKQNTKKLLLTIGVISNLFLLGYYKYTDFIVENINFIADTNFSLLNLTLPLAISFFTFQQIAYLVDSYKNPSTKYDLLNYSVFVTFFPQLIAGPIVHHNEMMPQFVNKNQKGINYDNIAKGLIIFSIGLFKKVVIADTFAKWANMGFDSTSLLYFYEAWGASLSYTFQLYFDFSGYSDMAIGLALLFHIKLPLNFNSPYKALNIQDFWRRWHMTLSRFLRDYIYIPLGGNRKSNLRTYVNLLSTFVIGGIWHGAGWTFIIWGTLHGVALIIHRFWSLIGIKLWNWLAWLITFNFINITWVFFRAESSSDAINIIKAMLGLTKGEDFSFSLNFVDSISMWFNYSFHDFIPFNASREIVNESSIILSLIALIFVLLLNNSNSYLDKKITAKLMLSASILFSVAVIFSFVSSTEVFLYFNF